MNKLTSRKFWICVAAMLASIATSIAGISTENQTVIIIGTVCGIISAAIYAFCEAWVDSKAVSNDYMDVLLSLLSNMNVTNEKEDDEDGK